MMKPECEFTLISLPSHPIHPHMISIAIQKFLWNRIRNWQFVENVFSLRKVISI